MPTVYRIGLNFRAYFHRQVLGMILLGSYFTVSCIRLFYSGASSGSYLQYMQMEAKLG